VLLKILGMVARIVFAATMLALPPPKSAVRPWCCAVRKFFQTWPKDSRVSFVSIRECPENLLPAPRLMGGTTMVKRMRSRSRTGLPGGPG